MKSFFNKLINKINGTNTYVIVLFLFAYLLIISLLLRPSNLNACDIAEYLNNPLRIINGDLPYRDFWLLFTPGEVYFPALLYKLFGVNIDIVCYTTLTVSLITPCLVFILVKSFLHTNFKSLVTSIIFYYTSVIYNYESPLYIHLYLTFSIISAIFVLKYFKNERNKDIFWTGIFIGIAFFFRFYEVGAVAFALTLSIIIFFIINKYSFKRALKSFSLFVLGTLIIFSIILLSFYSIVPVMIREVIFESVKNGTNMNLPYFYLVNNCYDTFMDAVNSVFVLHNYYDIFKLFFRFFLTFAYLGYYLLPFISVAVFIIYLSTKPDKHQLIIAVLFILWGLFMLPKGFGRSDMPHISPFITPLLFLSAFFYSTYRNIINKTLKIKIIYLTSATMLILLAYQIIYPYNTIVNLLRKPATFIKTENGTVAFKTKKEAYNYLNTLNFIEKNSTKDDYIFVTIWDAPSMFALSNRRNPTYYDSMNDLVVRPSVPKQIKLCKDLAAKNTKIIVHWADWGYDNKPEQTFRYACPIIQDYITTHYRLVAQYGMYHIYMQ